MWLCLSMALAIPAVGEDDCDCDHFPWKPDRCVDLCGAALLSQVTREEMVTFLDFDEEVVEKIVEARESEPSGELLSLGPVRESLSDTKFETVKDALERLEPLTGQYLLTPREERDKFRALVLSTGEGKGVAG
jgi:hypothetical protein